MGKPLAGEVVVLPFPQTNLQAGKRRPALVVAELDCTALAFHPSIIPVFHSPCSHVHG